MGEESAIVTAAEGSAEAKMAPQEAFVISCLDSQAQRNDVHQKIKEFIKGLHEKDESTEQECDIIHLGQTGWESVGLVASPTYYVITLCRKYGLLPTERSVLLSVRDQYQVIQLCLARINKKKHGEFMAAASDVLDVWNQMYQDTVASQADTEESCEELDLPNISQSVDPCMREMMEIIEAYNDFLRNSGCLDHFTLYKILKKHMAGKHEVLKDIASKVYILEAVSQMPAIERELVKILLQSAKAFRATVGLPLAADTSGTAYDLNMSGIGDVDDLALSQGNTDQLQQDTDKPEEDSQGIKGNNGSSIASLEIDSLECPLVEYLSCEPKEACEGYTCTESELYVEQLILSHLRLLINTRDELALTTSCSIPGREISQQGFADIKDEAQKKNMPMFQTILSFIMRLRLGGKGYQPDPENPVLLHAKPLGEFVDSIMKLQSVAEEEPDLRKASSKVLSLIKSGLVRMRGCVLKKATIEQVWGRLNATLDSLLNDHPRDGQVTQKVQQTKGLRPCLKVLLQLCDEISGHASSMGIVDALGEHFLTQCSSSRKTATPIRIPSVLSLFRSPAEAKDSNNGDGVDSEGNLLVRIMKKKGLAPKEEAQPQRFQSSCAWAPEDMSPVRPNGANNSLSPIVGPTLKAVGKGSRSSQNWREIVSSLPKREGDANDAGETEEAPPESTEETNKNEEKNQANPSEKASGKTKKKCSKRSLLSDIANISAEPEAKKAKAEATKPQKEKAPSKKSAKLKPIPKGQRSITAFFKT
ncbi:putative PCNA-interacting partner-like [Penaeus vannamei]|uniref:PCNA-interacting partner n=1 Tax=Penaeus vannamei TaxID=6689 RepID=A0A3R7QJF8_PENVA|nr:PCNA-interacting partner-like [Penaeus vannamei]ROT69432.1 putative PCNA-interacting partner-like [Penaeus vannamei]